MTDGIDLADRVQSATGGLQLSSAARQQHAQAMDLALNRVQEPSDGGNRSKTAVRVAAIACVVLLAGGYGLIAATQPQPDSLRLTGPAVTAITSNAAVTTARPPAGEVTPSTSTLANQSSTPTTDASANPATAPAETQGGGPIGSAAPDPTTPFAVEPPDIEAAATSVRTAETQAAPTTQLGGPTTTQPAITQLTTTQPVATQPTTTQPTTTQLTTTQPPDTQAQLPPQVVPLDLYLLSSAGRRTSSSRSLPFGQQPANTPLTNFDTDRDDEDGILIQKDGAGLSGNDPTKYQDWAWTLDEPTRLEGDMTLTVWAASKDFKTDEQIGIASRLEVCSPNCSIIGIGSWSRLGQSDFQRAEIRFTSIDTFVPAGATLVVRIATPDDLATNDSWIAFGASNYPAKLSIG